MRILVLTQIVPYPPDSGPKIKTLNVIRYLAQHHELHLLSYARSAAEEASAAALRSCCASVTTVPIQRSRALDLRYFARSRRTGRPFLVERDDLPAMRRAVQTLVRRYRFDAVHADQLTMGQFAVDLVVPLRVLDEHNAVWTILRRASEHERWGPERVLAAAEWRRLRAYEGALCRAFDAVTVVSQDDRYWLEAAAGGTIRATVAPIAVDTEALAFHPRSSDEQEILSVATMYYPPNAEAVHWFGREVFPIVRRHVPTARFTIVGSRPPKSILRLAARQPGIDVAGYVEDIDPLFRRASLLIVPVRAGSGMRVKILDAFSRGLPVVSTTMGVEGIDARSGEHLLVADTPSQLAAAVGRLLRDRALSERLAEAARDLAVRQHDWRTALQPLNDLYPPASVVSAQR